MFLYCKFYFTISFGNWNHYEKYPKHSDFSRDEIRMSKIRLQYKSKCVDDNKLGSNNDNQLYLANCYVSKGSESALVLFYPILFYFLKI